jgi:hypothetical protein
MDYSALAEDYRKAMERSDRKRRREELFTLEHFQVAIRFEAIKTIKLKAEGTEFALQAVTKEGKQLRLRMARGLRERKFRSVGTALKLLRDLGLKEVMVEIEYYRPTKGRFQKRPDMSERLRFAHEYARTEGVE